jgi:ADP-L-glycero-D-manno-heptose 6-epimerase
MIIVTGGGGFIGSAMVGYLNSIGRTDVVVIDDMPHAEQYKNLAGKEFTIMSADEINVLASFNTGTIDAVIHMGAITNTLHKEWDSIYKQNILATRQLAGICGQLHIPMVFASSAAIYGNGAGPLNQYALSKKLSETEIQDRAACLRFFNVYGPNEYHKERMASTILHWHGQIQETGSIKIFEDSDQYYRDFIYVEDVCRAVWHMVENFRPGVYDLGTGKSVNFERVARELIKHVDQEVYLDYIPMPADLKAQYQTDTKADTTALIATGFDVDLCRSVAEGIEDYAQYLKGHHYL